MPSVPHPLPRTYRWEKRNQRVLRSRGDSQTGIVKLYFFEWREIRFIT